MKALIVGAGVIGGYLAHVLGAAGQEVTLLARGAWKAQLEKEGLIIRHSLQRKTTVDHPRIVGEIDGERYDVVFAVMQHQQMGKAIPDLARVNAPIAVLVGNNLSPAAMEARLREEESPKTVLFGFQGTDGRREDGRVICVRAGAGSMSIGALHGEVPAPVKAQMEALFAGTKYALTWQPDMEAWYKCHAAMILPVAYLCYTLGCDLRRSTSKQRRQLLEAVREGYALLAAQGCPILPAGDEQYFEPGPKRLAMAAMICVMAKTAIGDLAASDHCRHAVEEMEGLDRAFEALRGKSPEAHMGAWTALRGAMPPWEELHALYDGGQPR